MQISIIVPVYNTEKYLRECIESILAQNDRRLELLLIDDGSTDSSGSICDEYAQAYPENVHVIHQQNTGALLTRRIGFSVAKGDYLLCMDADDYLLQGALRYIRKAIEKYDCDMVLFDYIYGKQKNKPEREIHVRPERENTFFVKEQKLELYRQLLVGRYLNSLCIKAVKHSLIDSDADYDRWRHVTNGDDALQTMPLIDSARKIVYIPKVLYYYRRDNESMSKQYYINDYESFKSVYIRAMEYALKWGIAEEIRSSMEEKYIDINMMVIHDALKHESRETYKAFLKSLGQDEYFINLVRASSKNVVHWYYRILMQLISHQHVWYAKAVMYGMSVLQKTKK